MNAPRASADGDEHAGDHADQRDADEAHIESQNSRRAQAPQPDAARRCRRATRQAIITIAASADCGRFVVSHGREDEQASDRQRPDDAGQLGLGRRPDSATGVRDALALIGEAAEEAGPDVRHARAPAAPGPGRPGAPARPANVRDSTLVSAIETTAIASAAGHHRGDVLERDAGTAKLRQALRQRPDDRRRRRGGEAEHRGEDRGADRRDEDAGTLPAASAGSRR